MKKFTIAFVLLLIIIKINAQPSNDDCQFAQAIIIPSNGTTCISSTNTGATPDAIPPNGCNAPTGGNEVWFTYVATGTQNTITVTPSAVGGAQSVVVTVPNGNCSSLLPLICNAAGTPGGTAVANFIETVGTQVWFEVSALAADGNFDICVSSVNPVPGYAAGVADSCFTAVRLCDKHSFIGTPPPIFANSGQQISCYAFPAAYLSDIWYKFTVGKTGTLEWICTPQVGLDIDWEVLDITGGCAGAPVICCNKTYNPAGGDPTGMDASSGTPCGTGATHINSPLVITAGNTYAIHLNYTAPSANTFLMQFSGSFEIAPYPDFYVDNPSGCAPLLTDFTDSSYAVTTYNWNFGNGITSVGSNPAVQTYSTPGTYMVSLTANDAATGCVQATSKAVNVIAPPSSTFTASPGTVCINSDDTITYTGNATAAAAYNWNFNGATVISGSGQGPYIIQWTTAGAQVISLDVTENGCTSAVTNVNVTVTGPPPSTFNLPAGACTGDTVLITFTGVATATSQFYWSLGNSFIASTNGTDTFYVVWSNPGSDSVYLIIDDQGCVSATTTHYINIANKPTSSFTLTDTVCSSQQAIAVYTGTGTALATYNWNFGSGVATPGGTTSGPQNISYTTPGYHTVSLIVNEQGCYSSNSMDSVLVVTAPTATFTISNDSLCGNASAIITYTGTGTSAAGFIWTFNTANIISGSGSGPYTINYPSAGLDYITLSVTQNSCTSVKTDSILTADIPVANAGSDVQYCAGDSAHVGAAPTAGYQYAWTPAGAVSGITIANPYSIIGNATTAPTNTNLYLTVTNKFCTDKDTVKVTVNPKQNASIKVTPSVAQCLNVNSFNFSNTATTVTGGMFNWDFTAAASIPTSTNAGVNNVSFNAPGNYLVHLITSSASCPNDTDTVTVTVYDVPKAGFTADTLTGCPPVTVNFTDTSSAPAGSSYLWNFGNGDTSSLVNSSETYTHGGNFTVSLTITSPGGCTSESIHSNLVTVTDEPHASFEAFPQVTNIIQPAVSFVSTSVNADSCLYLFGDGGFSTECNVAYSYNDTGTYLVTLITKSAGGCSDTAYQTVRVEDYYTLYIPNSFTPNNDAVNDVFSVSGLGIKEFAISIFNNHGQLVFDANNQKFTWNGRDVNGNPVPEGNYVYEAVIRDVLGKKHRKTGGIVVIR